MKDLLRCHLNHIIHIHLSTLLPIERRHFSHIDFYFHQKFLKILYLVSNQELADFKVGANPAGRSISSYSCLLCLIIGAGRGGGGRIKCTRGKIIKIS